MKPISYYCEITLIEEVPQAVRSDPDKTVYSPTDFPGHPKGATTTLEPIQTILSTLKADRYYSELAFDPTIYEPNAVHKTTQADHPVMPLRTLSEPHYFLGKDLYELIADASNKLSAQSVSTDLLVSAHKQDISQGQWKTIEAQTGPLSPAKASSLAQGLVVELPLQGIVSNVAFRPETGLISTQWPNHLQANSTFARVMEDRVHPSLKNLTDKQRNAIVWKLSDVIEPSVQQLKTGNINQIFPKPLFSYALGISELNKAQIDENSLKGYKPETVAEPTLLTSFRQQLETIKPHAPYRIYGYFDPDKDILPIYQAEGLPKLNRLENAINQTMDGQYVLGQNLDKVLTQLIQLARSILGKQAAEPYLELKQNQYTITPPELKKIEQITGKLSSFQLYALSNGQPVEVNNKEYLYKPDLKGIPLTKATETERKPTKYSPTLIDQCFNSYGVELSPRDRQKLVTGQKTDLVRIDNQREGKFVIEQKPGQSPSIKFLEKKNSLQIPRSFRGYTFTPDDLQSLRTDGELGKLVTFTSKQGKKFNGYLGVDKDLNSLSLLRQDKFALPTAIKGIVLTPAQQDALKSGKSIRLDNLIGTHATFSAEVRISASMGSLRFGKPREVKAHTSNPDLTTLPQNKTGTKSRPNQETAVQLQKNTNGSIAKHTRANSQQPQANKRQTKGSQPKAQKTRNVKR